MRIIKKAQRTISRPCTICGKLILKGQQYQYMLNVGSYKHLACIKNKQEGKMSLKRDHLQKMIPGQVFREMNNCYILREKSKWCLNCPLSGYCNELFNEKEAKEVNE